MRDNIQTKWDHVEWYILISWSLSWFFLNITVFNFKHSGSYWKLHLIMSEPYGIKSYPCVIVLDNIFLFLDHFLEFLETGRTTRNHVKTMWHHVKTIGVMFKPSGVMSNNMFQFLDHSYFLSVINHVGSCDIISEPWGILLKPNWITLDNLSSFLYHCLNFFKTVRTMWDHVDTMLHHVISMRDKVHTKWDHVGQHILIYWSMSWFYVNGHNHLRSC